MSKFKPVSSQVDFPALEKELLEYWHKNQIVEKYLKRNENSQEKFSFLDGPITANNPMGVHHAWGRTYKDLWQRFYNMKGHKQRFQNGYDEQGLWVEVEVEKELGLKSKKDIENLVPGDKNASLEKFVDLCKERVKKYSAVITEQSKRLGYFMDWDNSYHTSSEKNNYSIWHFLKVIYEKGWLYKGRDSVPWCPRCGTAISQHEISTEEYKELTHNTIFVKYPVVGKKGTYLLIWTTTPWTIPANVAVAVDPNLSYLQVEFEGEKYIVACDKAASIFPEGHKVGEYKGSTLVGWEYEGPYDDLPAVKEAFGDYRHQVVASDPVILPISTEEGTGLVHIAPGAGTEDFALGRERDLPIVGPIDETGTYFSGYGWMTGLTVKEVGPKIIEEIKEKGFLFQTQEYTHRYPICWRCKTELLWRVVDEWYISMDKVDESGQTYREQLIEIAKKINWLPKWGLERELDWLKNMHDWLISKKRYWGLALPIWECPKCNNFEVVGSLEELKERATVGWKDFEGHSPHKPWIDEVKIKCSKCKGISARIPDVGNPWLDAGIVPFSTLPEGWFPADFVTEAFPGQFKNWFYSLLAMSTALAKTNPFKNLLGHALVVDEKGEQMHKSAGNSIEFNEAADEVGVDVMRWLFTSQNPENDLRFGFGVTSEIKRRFYLILWNCYKFFIDYALLTNWEPEKKSHKLTILDQWIIGRLNELVLGVNRDLEKYDAMSASKSIEEFVVSDFSTWYIRRSRDRVGPGSDPEDEKVFLSTSYEILLTLSKLLSPFMPFVSEIIYQNLTEDQSVLLTDYPEGEKFLIDKQLIDDMLKVRRLAEIGLSLRKEASIKLRQPLNKFVYQAKTKLDSDLERILSEELNVKLIEYQKSSKDELEGKLDTKITQELREEGEIRELIRQIQQLRKESGLTLKDKIEIYLPEIPKNKEAINFLLKQTQASKIQLGKTLEIRVVND